MKIKNFNSTLSCILKCIRFIIDMANKKIFLSLLIVSFLGACTAPTAMLGPAYTLSSSGNVFQAGLSYGTNELITNYTGKTPIENIKEISLIENNKPSNIQKKTLESEDFYFLVKSKIEKTNSILKSSNQ